ncbi:MAG: radical SAM protein, partial [Acidobacteriaceae bacterium]|nr:radical SAM protein [Acidobacteriaceae bacterium]
HGRHEIFAGNKSVPLGSKDHSLVLNAEAVAKGAQTDLDELGIAKNAREEKLMARQKEHDPAYHAEMAKLYAQHVLKEQPTVQIQGLGKKKQNVQEVLHKPKV